MGILFKVFLILISCVVIIIIKSSYEIKHYKIREYTIITDKIDEDLKILFFSDLHNCEYGKNNIKLIKDINNSESDLIIIGGDLIIGKSQKKNRQYFDKAVELLNGIRNDIPVLYVYGNHETRIAESMRNEYLNKLNNKNIIMLNNKEYIYGKIKIYGKELEAQNYKEKNYIEQYNKTISNKNYNILVVHTPEFVKEYIKNNYDLILSGHNHGGTIRLPFIGGVVSRDFEILPKYTRGLYFLGKSKLLMTSGLGDHTIKFRLFNQPELVKINFNKEIELKKIKS